MKKPQPKSLASVRELHRVKLPMPEGLGKSLRAIAEDEANCDDLARLYPSAENRDAPRDAASRNDAAERHLAACARCRRLYGALERTFTAEPLPMPASLSRRLLAIPRSDQPSLPLWLLDARVAVAASYLLATLLLLPLGDPGTLFEEATSFAKSRATAWTARTESESQEIWTALSTKVASGYEHSKERLELHGASYTRLYSRTVRLFSSLKTKPFFENDPSIQGGSHGRTT